MTKALHCHRCRVRLTKRLTVVSGKDPAVARPDIVTGRAVVEPGVAFKAWEAMPWFHAEPGHPLDFVPQFWLNPEDLTEMVAPLARRMTGCCGPSGLDGPNQVCRCKAEVGTLQDDCFTPRVFIPNPKTTTWVEGEGDDWNYS